MHFSALLVKTLLAGGAIAAPSMHRRQLQTIQGAITTVQSALDDLTTAVQVRKRFVSCMENLVLTQCRASPELTPTRRRPS